MWSADDRRFMGAALRLSRWHLGLTGANPSVGCVIVKDGRILGAAVTAQGGRPHAETQALDLAGEEARGATAYVTLEPCSHFGKTPPCANALVAAGVSRVVICLTDPDPRVSGRGISILRDAGIQVEIGLLEEEGRRALAGYLMRKTKHRPHVTLKLAVSADGMLGRRGEEVSITGPLARAQVHVLRAESDAILVGIGTVMADDPELTVRLPGMTGRSPIRIVLDRRLELPLTSHLVRSASGVPVIVASVQAPAFDAQSDPERDVRRDALLQAGVEVLETGSLSELLHELAGRGISSLFVEGGATVAATFFHQNLADRVILSQGPGEIGPGGLESPLKPSDMAANFVMIRAEAYGRDLCFEYERSF
ncbi:bifunctional diaminohydroxyphosphoribosylaminopyrimidine deaminase/5-amino-6-(5-phosphoribosylamino)uracil reductase RibD [Neorhizobium lilium]|uniref:Riboflavin biosynthesis protein RibD n=1 Tax=Neorhizobium lilium TaxID=2503024 RepID=A0A3S3SB39_9HYPH|nr:bifunctional diaminohydroxyphosphoribosylaminopyrimidine deaminase/5-amino-6-(5-phosphoribosylamino)uracil reductase RibD [Neorhizobium lilium]RWX75811.1 bifunctional diaminohydroxyphosphoribosylaminopyrimidine deaminase/5-amino-6-(5-phosphoribosylamino)uracil reductase RibD [Neorhizobium lilium]